MEQESLASGTRAAHLQHPGDRRHAEDRGARRRAGRVAARGGQPRRSASRSPASHITVGLQCGGSDGYSGISANPALGAAVDRLVRHGGTAILSETPEIYGGEHLLTRRAVSPAVADKLIARIRWWERYTERNDAEMDNNPSAGNKAGGLTTILEKSLGAIAKSGTTNLTDVFEYAAAGHDQGPGLHGHAGLRPGLGDRPGRRRRQPDLLHHRPRLGLRLRAVAVAQARAPTPRCGSKQEDDIDINCGEVIDGSAVDRRDGRAHLPADARDRVGRARPRARSTATARTSSCPGRSAR